MDLIYMNSEKEDVGVLLDYTFDLAFGADENNFECVIVRNNHCCNAGYYLYIEGTEYGGIIDGIAVDTDAEEVTYTGRTWHGILESKVLKPDAGEDYLVVSGDANSVLSSLIDRMGLASLFMASSESSGITILNYQMDRYITGYSGIRKMLKSSGAKLNVSFEDGFAVLSAVPLVDYTQDDQFDDDLIDFRIQKNNHPVNHIVCLGKGDLKDREVIHLFVDGSGNISENQVFTGVDEVESVYDNANAESTDELRSGGIEKLEESWNADTIEFDFNSDDESYDVGDIIGAKENVTGIEVAAEITKKIVTIKDNTTTIAYKVGE